MAEDDKSAAEAVAGLVHEFTGKLRAITEKLEDLAGFSGGHPLAPGALPLPGSFSAAQMTAIADSITAQRRSIAALQAQLSSFDEQLAALERLLDPLTEWSRTWADLEQRLLPMGRRPENRPPPPPGDLLQRHFVGVTDLRGGTSCRPRSPELQAE